MTVKIEYEDGKGIIPEDSFRISPSGISRFFSNTSSWYRENLLGEGGFTGNAGSVSGSIAHYIMECFLKGEKHSTETAERYVRREFVKLKDLIEEQTPESILRNGYTMGSALRSYFEAKVFTGNLEDFESERFHWLPLTDSVVVGGSIDLYDKRRASIVDFKTRSSTLPPRAITQAYMYQQLVYAYIIRSKGYDVEYIEIWSVNKPNVNRVSAKTGKPLKDYPSTVTPLKHAITEADMEFIESILMLVADSVTHWNKNPKSRYLLAQDYRLKGTQVLINNQEEDF